MARKKKTRSSMKYTLLAGVATIASFVWMTHASGGSVDLRREAHNKRGFMTAIVYFEMAENADEVFDVLGPRDSDEGLVLRDRFDTLNRADFFFMVSYCAYMLLLHVNLLSLHRIRGSNCPGGRKSVMFGSYMACVALFSDITENVLLLRLTEAPAADQVPDALINLLWVATRCKWGALFVSCGVAGVSYAIYFAAAYESNERPQWKRWPTLSKFLMPRWFGAREMVLPTLFLGAAALGLLGVFLPKVAPAVEMGMGLMAVAWLFVLLHTFVCFFQIEVAHSGDGMCEQEEHEEEMVEDSDSHAHKE
jgi:hypothetical protein